MKKILISILLGFTLLGLKPGFAQGNKVTVQLLDNITKAPIDGATYQYANLKGISDIQGRISFSYSADNTLSLSHISYGDWTLTAGQLEKAIKKGVIYKDHDIFKMQPVTVLALRPKQGDMEQLRLDISDKLSHDAGAVLNQSPAVNSIRKSGAYGFDPVLRGFKYDQLNIVINGTQSAVAACPNRMDPPTSQVTPNMMEHVQILKGPHSFRYGTSFGGTINFEMSPMRFSKTPDFYGRLSGSSESNGGIYRTEGVIGFSGEKYNLGLLGSWSSGEDYKDGADISVPAAFSRISYGVNAGIALTENQQLILTASRNVADKTDFPALPMDLISDETSLINLQHKMNLGGQNLRSWNTTVYATAVDHLMNNLEKELSPRMLNAKTTAETYSYGGRTEGSWLFNDSKMFTGVDLRIEKTDGTRTRDFLMGPMMGKTIKDNVWNGGQVSRMGVFGEYHHLFTSFKMIASGRLEFNQAKVNDVNDTFETRNPKTNVDQINPNFSIGGFRDFDNGMNLGLWFGHAQRSGSITERYINSFPVGLDPYDMLGNPRLDPEINNQVDLMLGFKSENTSVDINLFSSFLQDYISSEIDTSLTPTMPSSPGVRRFNNIKNALMVGFEVGWQQRLFAGIKHQMSIAFTYGKDKTRNEPLPEISPLDFRYTLTTGFLENKLRPLLSFRYVMKQERISEAFGESDTPAFSLVDFGFTYQIINSVSTTLGVKNLLDQEYYEHLNRSVKGTTRAIHAPGRNVYLSISVDMM